jgi:hypothetical protein
MTDTMGIWREPLIDVATATTASVDSDPVPPGERWYVQRVAVYNDTTDNADCLVSIWDGMKAHALYYFKNITVTEWASQAVECWLREGESLRFDWSGIVSGETLKMTVTGHKRLRD